MPRPNDPFLKAMNIFHKTLLKVSGGKLGWKGGGMPVLELTTTGRKSGQARTVMLTSPIQDGDTIVIVASKGGNDENPAWLLNLRDKPEADVVFNGEPKKRMHAHIPAGDERAEMWKRVVAVQPRYGEYQSKTSREIPLVLLQPAPSGG